MKIRSTELEGVYIIEAPVFEDNRGVFSKTFHKDFFAEHDLRSDFAESFYSVSNRNVIRGMHFQLPPYEHAKLVYVPAGSILDVILDLRSTSNTYGKSISVELSARNRLAVYIPEGLAHGFKSLEDNSITVYNVSTVYNKDCDSGIHYQSIGFNWMCEKPVISQRDDQFPGLQQFKTPF